MADDSTPGGPTAPKPRRAKPCPICRKMSLEAFYPFCSKRCADIDLSRWFGGVYATPAATPPDDMEPGPDEER